MPLTRQSDLDSVDNMKQMVYLTTHTRTRHYWCSRSDVGIAIGIPNAKTRATADNQLCFAAVSPRWIATEPRNKYTPKRIDDE